MLTVAVLRRCALRSCALKIERDVDSCGVAEKRVAELRVKYRNQHQA